MIFWQFVFEADLLSHENDQLDHELSLFARLSSKIIRGPPLSKMIDIFVCEARFFQIECILQFNALRSKRVLGVGNQIMNKGGKFLKKLWCCVGGSITRQSGFINWVDNVNLPPVKGFETDVLSVSPSSEQIEKCGLCVVYIQKDDATPLVGAWQREKQQNKLVE